MKRYDRQYCPIARSLELVGERWTLLVVRELMHGPRRYTDLADGLPRIGSNVLAARLKELEAGGVVEKRKLPPPFASTVYELTPLGRSLRPVLHELARFGARLLGPPPLDALEDGWLVDALDLALSPVSPRGAIAFRIGAEEATLIDGVVSGGHRRGAGRSRRGRRGRLLPSRRGQERGRRPDRRRPRAARAAARRLRAYA